MAYVVTKIPGGEGWRSTTFMRFTGGNTQEGQFGANQWEPFGHTEHKTKLAAFEEAAGSRTKYSSNALFARRRADTATGDLFAQPKANVVAQQEQNKNVPAEEKENSTQINLPPDLAKQFLDYAATIPDVDLYNGEEGQDSYGPDYGREDKPHVTVLFGLGADKPEQVQRTVEGM